MFVSLLPDRCIMLERSGSQAKTPSLEGQRGFCSRDAKLEREEVDFVHSCARGWRATRFCVIVLNIQDACVFLSHMVRDIFVNNCSTLDELDSTVLAAGLACFNYHDFEYFEVLKADIDSMPLSAT